MVESSNNVERVNVLFNFVSHVADIFISLFGDNQFYDFIKSLKIMESRCKIMVMMWRKKMKVILFPGINIELNLNVVLVQTKYLGLINC
jgi:hypothetical protein